MSASTNINKVYFNGKTSAYAERVLYQWDYGQVLQFPDLELPAAYQVHFSTAPTAGSAYDMLGTADGVSIPDSLLEEGRPIYAWIFLHAGEDDGETVRVAVIYVKPRSKPISETPTPAQQSAWDEAISALSAALEEAQALAEAIPEEIDSALEAAKASGEFDGEDGADGSNAWLIDVAYTNTVGTTIRAQTEHLIGPPNARPMYGDVLFVSDGRFGNITSPGTRITQVSTLGDLHGAPGENGYAPEVTIEQIDGGHRVTITSAAHPEGQSFDVMDGQGGGGGITVDDALSGSSTNPVQNKVIKAALDEKANTSSVPTKTSDLQNDAGFLTQHQSLAAYRTAAAQDEIDQQIAGAIPTKTSDLQNDSGFLTQHQSLAAYRTAADQDTIDAGKADKVTEVTVSTAGDVTAQLDPGKIYHFTGAISSLTLTLATPASGQLAQYHFDFDSGSTAATISITGVTWPGGSFAPEASTHYEVDILNGYGLYIGWEVTP